MAFIVGTYTSVKTQDLVDFLLNAGVSKDVASRTLGSRWTLKVWKEGDVWGIYLKCREIPALNVWNSFVVGVEKQMSYPMFGGSCKVLGKKVGDGLSLTIDSDSCGKVVYEAKFTEDGMEATLSAKGSTVKGFWERRVKEEGCYKMDKAENVEAYYNAIGRSDLIKHFKDYKIHMYMSGKNIRMSEYIGDFGRICNDMELDLEVPFRVSGDKTEFSPSKRAIITRAGIGKYIIMFKSKAGQLEEWKLAFDRMGMTMCGRDLSSGVTCKFHLKRFFEMAGTYKMVRMVGFERFATLVAKISVEDAQSMMSDCSTKLVITDLGHGTYRHQLIRTKYSMDLTFRMNEEFSFMHPIVNETIKVMAKMDDDSTMVMTSTTSRGTIFSKLYFSNEFVILSVSLAEANMRYKIIFTRVSH